MRAKEPKVPLKESPSEQNTKGTQYYFLFTRRSKLPRSKPKRKCSLEVSRPPSTQEGGGASQAKKHCILAAKDITRTRVQITGTKVGSASQNKKNHVHHFAYEITMHYQTIRLQWGFTQVFNYIEAFVQPELNVKLHSGFRPISVSLHLRPLRKLHGPSRQ